MSFRKFGACAALIFGLCLTACGGHTHDTATSLNGAPNVIRSTPAVLTATPPEPGLAGQLPSIPAPEYLTMPRITASIDAGALGSEYTSHGGDVTLDGTQAKFVSTPQHVSWAIYSFGGDPGEVISALNYVVTGLDPGEKVYCAISDYVTNRWLFIPLQPGGTVNFSLPSSAPGAYQSSMGNTTVMFAAFGGDAFELSNLSLTYANRHSITGKVLDKTGAPVAGVTIKTPVGSLSTVTDASGDYTLAGLPDGDWPVLATLNGWTFYPQPVFVSIAGADGVAGDLLGDPHGARFTATDLLPGNNSLQSAPLWDFAANGPLHESVSADDDFLDVYSFVVSTPGHYVLKYSNPDRNIFGPEFAVFTQQVDGVYFAEDIYTGEVALDFTVTTAPQTIRFLLAAVGGGGNYTISLDQQPVGRLGLYMKSGAAIRAGGIVQVVRADDGIETDYFTRSPISNNTIASVYDRSYPIGAVTATPVLPNHTFTPASADLTVTDSSTVASQIFTFTPPAIADSYEPNNDLATAHAITLPYNSPDPLQVTADYGGDYQDFFKVTPAAGLGLRATVLYSALPSESTGTPRIKISIKDHLGDDASNTFPITGGVVAEASQLTDGNPYYIVVAANPSTPADAENISYALQASSYAAHRFQIGARVGGVNPVDGMKFDVYDPTFTSRYQIDNNTADYLTPARYVPSGSQFRVDCYRAGTPFDRLTQTVTVTADTTLNFDAPSLGPDSHEPNGTFATASPLAFLPVSVDATFSAFDDSYDYYSFGPGDGRPFKIELTNCDPGVGLNVAMFDSTSARIGNHNLIAPGTAMYMPNDGNPGQAINIGLYNDYSFAYSIKISNADAYKISGVVKNTALAGLDGVVVNETTGTRAYSVAGSGGAYSFDELLAPGTYMLACYAIGYAPALVEQSVTISTLDATANFQTFTATVDDNYEPNNTPATAFGIAINTDYSAAADTESLGDFDYYQVPLSRGDQVRITVTPQNQWEKAEVVLLDQYSAGTNEDIVSSTGVGGVREIDYTAPADTNYVIKVTGGYGFSSDAGRYTLRVQKVN